MSEKRARSQQRRQRRKAQGASRSRTREPSRERLMAEAAALAAEAAAGLSDAFDAEQWASGLVGTWRRGRSSDDRVFLAAFVRSLEALRSAPALAALRALSALEVPGDAGAAADRLAAAGLPEPAWGVGLGRRRPMT